MKELIAYTDGSANWKTGEGGSACVFTDNENVKVFRQRLKNTKTGRSEINAFLIALKKSPKNVKLTILSDSMYVVNAINKQWLKRWLIDDFLGVKNRDLWKAVVLELIEFNKSGGIVEVQHVKGHSGVLYNELADSFADYKSFIR